MRARFSGHPYPGGLFVLDTWTGEVVKVPEDGSRPTVLRPAVVSAPAPALPDHAPAPPAPEHAPARPTMSALEREVVHAFPYPIARTYAEYLREPDPRQRCKLLVDTFTQVLKSWSLITASEYLQADGVEDVAVNHTLARDFQRPLISAWNLMLARAIPVLEERGIAPLAPELWRAYRALESHCRDKVALETPYRDAAGAVKVRTAKLGRIQALIRYRNSLAHGYNQSRDKARDDLATFAPVLESVLESARFCTRYPLFYAPPEAARASRTRDVGHTIDAYRLMGAAPARALERIAISEPLLPSSRLFVYDPASQRALGLGLFFDVDDAAQGSHAAEADAGPDAGTGWDVLTFEGHTRTTMIYASVTGGLVEKQGRLDEWRALMARKEVPGAALTLAELTWSELLAAAGRVTGETLATLAASGRYIPEVTIARPSYERLLDDFECSDYRAFVVAGDHGMGKSTLLARYAESRRDKGDLVLLYRAAALRDAHLPERVLRDLGVRNAFFEDFLAALASVVPAGARVRLIVDSLHEHPSATHELTRAVDALVRQAASYPFVRVLVSIRGAAYERLPADARFGLAAPGGYFTVEEPHSAHRTLLIDMAPLTDAQVAEAYERYRAYARPESDEVNPGAQVFRPLTPFTELAGDGATVALMRVPLFVRLLCAAFAHKPLPAHLSFDQAMEPYMDHVVLERDEAHGGYPERRRFLQTLVTLLDGESADSVSRDRLYGVPSLAGHLTNPQKDSAYVQLLELGILIEVWDDDRCAVRFAFEGLFEYLLAELHYPRIDSPAALLALVERAHAFKSLRAGVVIIMRRALRTGRHALILDACDMCRVAPSAAEAARADDPGAGERAGAMLASMMRDLIIDLARFRDPGFEVLCREMPATASRFDVQVVTAAFDALFTAGEIAAAEILSALADHMARELDEAGLLSEALFRRARVAVQRGLSDAAFGYLDEAGELAESAGEARARLRVALLRAQLLMTQGQNERAARVFDDAYRGFVGLGELSDASVAVRGLANIAAREEQLERAAELGREAIDLAERAGDPASMAKALNNLAMVQSRRGDTEAALASLERSLAIKEMIGDRASIATTALNLGALYFGRGHLREAEARFRAALATFDALEHGRGCAASSCNLALLAQFQGDPERAGAHLARSIELSEASGDARGLAQASWFQASLWLDCGRVDEARAPAARLAELAESLATRQLALQCACLDARMALAAGAVDIEPALERVEALARELEAETWEVEDGPASTFLDAARWAHENRRDARAHALIASARAVVRGRPYARARELAAVEQAVADALAAAEHAAPGPT